MSGEFHIAVKCVKSVAGSGVIMLCSLMHRLVQMDTLAQSSGRKTSVHSKGFPVYVFLFFNSFSEECSLFLNYNTREHLSKSK